MRLKITHHTVYRYDAPVSFVVQSLRTTPSAFDGQKVIDWTVSIDGAEAGPGFAYAAPGRELREVWKDQMTNAVSGAELVPGWLPVFGPETVRELETALADTEKSL